MSCNCKKNTAPGEPFVCRCDEFIHPSALRIDAGLTDLPRQIAGFPMFRRAMLRSVGTKPPLAGWRARGQDDPGIMLLEMWAYICDSLAFYDQVIAEENYVNTANLRTSIRKLVALLGYLPTPAVGSTVTLAAIAEGVLTVNLPQGLAFRSEGFQGNSPQIFELEKNALINPFTSKWGVLPVRPGTLAVDNPGLLLIQQQTEIKPFTKLLLLDYENPAQHQLLRVRSVNPYTGADGKKYSKLLLQFPATLDGRTALSRLWLLLPAPDSILSSVAAVLEKEDSTTRTALRKTADKFGILEEFNRNLEATGSMIRVKDSAGNIVLMDMVDLALRYAAATAGVITNEESQKLLPADPILFDKRAEKPDDGFDPDSFTLADKNGRNIIVNGKINYADSSLELSRYESWQPGLLTPVQAFGNLIHASRGETVDNEIIGSGNAASSNQSFRLKKKPLTYLLAPTALNDHGIENTLRVYVDNIRWKEVPGFYGISGDEEIYIVRQDDEGETNIIFGDGIRGKRLPTGRDNVVAYYRFGAERACPPANTITQIKTPLDGLRSINNPIAAAGGDDAEPADKMQHNAPRSALILGRAVSIQDMEAVSLAVPGVRAAQVEWHWHGTRQAPVVQVWYIGEAGIEELLTKRLRSVTDPTTPIVVERANGIAATLSINVDIDPRYQKAKLLNDAFIKLTDPQSGMLAPENIGIGTPLYRSQIFGALLSVDGIVAVKNITWNGDVLSAFAVKPDAGNYFDLEKGKLELTGNQ